MKILVPIAILSFFCYKHINLFPSQSAWFLIELSKVILLLARIPKYTLIENQHSFSQPSYYSWLTAHFGHLIAGFCDFIIFQKCLNFREEMHVIYSDFPKVFDSAHHTIVLTKLASLNIPMSFIRWLVSYLINRSGRVSLAVAYSVSFSLFWCTARVHSRFTSTFILPPRLSLFFQCSLSVTLRWP